MQASAGTLPSRRPAAVPRATLALVLVAGGVHAWASGAVEVTMERTPGPPQPPAAVRTAGPTELSPSLPETVAGWRRVGATRTIEPAAIFEYMDGAGELYLAYRLDHLEVAEYRSDPHGDILVELYRMRSSDDAFGLLSGDWGGEEVELGPAAGNRHDGWPRALYGSGLLRIWSDDLYVRILASRESAEARDAVLALGRAITEGRRNPPPPRIATVLPASVGPGLRLRTDRLCFLRSHLVLNSIYFLGQRDMLDLGPSVEAVFAQYELSSEAARKGGVKVLAVRYASNALAGRALARFREAYLLDTAATPATGSAATHIEDGWTAYRLTGNTLAIVFGGPDRKVATALLDAVASGVVAKGGLQ